MVNFLLNKFIPEKEAKVDFAEPIFYLNMIGLNPFKRGKMAVFLKTLGLTAYFPFIVLCLAGLLENFNLEGFSDRMDFIMPQIQIFGKACLYLLRSGSVSKLIIKTKEFCSLNDVRKEDKIYVYEPHKLLRIVYKIYQIMLWVNAFLYIWSPFVFYGRPGFILYRQTEENTAPLYDLQMFFMFTFTIFAVNCFLGYDGALFYFLAHLLGEVRTVRKTFENLNKMTSERKDEVDGLFKIAVDRHVRIMRFIKLMSGVYGTFFLIQYMATLISVCIALFFVARSSAGDSMSRNLLYILTFLIPMWVNCYLGDILYHECLIADAIFYKDWSKNNSYRNKWGTVLAIQRSQKVEVLSIGGFASLDLRSFTQLLKTSTSFYAMVDSIQNKSEPKRMSMF